MTSKINCDSLLAAPPQPPRDLSESEVAKSFSQYVREIARFVPGRGWYVYSGVKWEQSTVAIGLLLQRYIDSLQSSYLQQGMVDRSSQFIKFKNKRPQDNVLSLATRYHAGQPAVGTASVRSKRLRHGGRRSAGGLFPGPTADPL